MHDVEDFEVHLATCPACARELARYREVMAAVGSLSQSLESPSVGFTERVLAQVTSPADLWRSRAATLVRDRRVHVAAASLGGALLGATAMAIVWRRVAKRAVAGLESRVPA
jgi:anti-sigma factor RsiW